MYHRGRYSKRCDVTFCSFFSLLLPFARTLGRPVFVWRLAQKNAFVSAALAFASYQTPNVHRYKMVGFYVPSID